MWAFAYRDRIAFDRLERIERPDPVVGPYDILLEMKAVALNYRDLAIARGRYHATVTPPLIPISDGAGAVVAVGEKVTRFQLGDLACPTYFPDWIDGPISPRVAARRLGGPSDGVLRQYMCLNEQEAVKAPAHLGPEEASTLPVAAVTAWHSLHRIGQVRPGETVVVQGAGGVSTAAIQYAHAAGARTIAVVRRGDHADRLRELGAHHVLINPEDDLARQVFILTDGRGADTVLDVAGGASLARSIKATRVGGRVHLVGYAAGIEAGIDIFEALRHAVTVSTATAGNRESFEAMVRAIALHEIRPAIAITFPIEDIAQAFERLTAGANCGKIVVRL